MIKIEIPLEPVPWSAHKGFGKKSFNPRYKEREACQWYIRQQYKDKPIEESVSIFYVFHFPVPKSTSQKKRMKMLCNEIHHTKRPDKTNCEKFTEDCLKGIIITDDNLVCNGSSCKLYAENPRVVIKIFTGFFWNG